MIRWIELSVALIVIDLFGKNVLTKPSCALFMDRHQRRHHVCNALPLQSVFFALCRDGDDRRVVCRIRCVQVYPLTNFLHRSRQHGDHDRLAHSRWSRARNSEHTRVAHLSDCAQSMQFSNRPPSNRVIARWYRVGKINSHRIDDERRDICSLTSSTEQSRRRCE